MEQYKQVSKNWRELVINNFLGGISWGLGATIGASLVVAVLGFALSKINLIPFVGEFVSQITNFVIQNNPNLQK